MPILAIPPTETTSVPSNGPISGQRRAAALNTHRILLAQIRGWVRDLVPPDAAESGDDGFLTSLYSGNTLLELLERIAGAKGLPSASGGRKRRKRRHRRKPPHSAGLAAKNAFFARENVLRFLERARELGVPEAVMFSPGDLVERKNDGAVVKCLMGLALVAYRDFGVPPPEIIRLQADIERQARGRRGGKGGDEPSEGAAGAGQERAAESAREDRPNTRRLALGHAEHDVRHREGSGALTPEALHALVELVLRRNGLPLELVQRVPATSGCYDVGKPGGPRTRVHVRELLGTLMCFEDGRGWEEFAAHVRRQASGGRGAEGADAVDAFLDSIDGSREEEERRAREEEEERRVREAEEERRAREEEERRAREAEERRAREAEERLAREAEERRAREAEAARRAAAAAALEAAREEERRAQEAEAAAAALEAVREEERRAELRAAAAALEAAREEERRAELRAAAAALEAAREEERRAQAAEAAREEERRAQAAAAAREEQRRSQAAAAAALEAAREEYERRAQEEERRAQEAEAAREHEAPRTPRRPPARRTSLGKHPRVDAVPAEDGGRAQSGAARSTRRRRRGVGPAFFTTPRLGMGLGCRRLHFNPAHKNWPSVDDAIGEYGYSKRRWGVEQQGPAQRAGRMDFPSVYLLVRKHLEEDLPYYI